MTTKHLEAALKAFNSELKEVRLDSFAMQNMRIYGAYTVENRAVPDWRDGLKPVQRRSLWATHTLGINSKAPFKKSARIVGDCFSEGTPVSTPNGNVPIEMLEIGDLVNTSQGTRKVTHVIQNPPSQMFKLELANGNFLVLTPDQCVKIQIRDEFFWKPAKDLTPADIIVVETLND